MKKIMKYFINGLLVMLPVVGTLFVFYIVFAKVDKLFVRIPIPGVGLLITFIIITIVGFLTSLLVTQKYFKFMSDLLDKMPLVKLLYSSMRDLINAFVGKEKKFNKPALITLFPGQGIKVMGFITTEDLEVIGVNDAIAVYVPQSYNFAGNLLIVPKSHVTPLDIPAAKAMAIIVSAAVAGKYSYNKDNVAQEHIIKYNEK
ncbi:MAG: DUF502 domain-containing protein [Elusimicrobiota bacterium]